MMWFRKLMTVLSANCETITAPVENGSKNHWKRQANHIWKTEENGSKNELFVHLKTNAAFANAPAAIREG